MFQVGKLICRSSESDVNAQETYNDQLKNVEIICLSITPFEKRIVVALLFCSYRIITFFNVNPNKQIGIMTFITSCCISCSQVGTFTCKISLLWCRRCRHIIFKRYSFGTYRKLAVKHSQVFSLFMSPFNVFKGCSHFISS